MKLTLKQEAFALAYIKTGNASAAYRSVYTGGKMKAKTVNEKASRLLKMDKVGARVSELRAPALAEAEMDAKETILEMARVARAKPDAPVTYAEKLRALEMMAKHLGLFEKDNDQKGENLRVEVLLVGPE